MKKNADRERSCRRSTSSGKRASASSSGDSSYDFTVDLHGMYAEDAMELMRKMLSAHPRCRILAVHGNGSGVLRSRIRSGLKSGRLPCREYFPGEVLFPVMIGTLFQQVLAATLGTLLFSKGRESGGKNGTAAGRQKGVVRHES